MIGARGQCPPGLLARHTCLGSLGVSRSGSEGVAEHPAPPGTMPHRVLTRTRGHLPRVQPCDHLPGGPWCLDQPATPVPHHFGLRGMAGAPWGEPGVFGHRAVAIRPVRPRQPCGLPRLVHTAAPRPVRPRTARVFGDPPLPLGSHLAVRSLPKGRLQAHDTTPICLQRFSEEPGMRSTAGSPIRREEDDRLKVAQAGLVP